MKTIDRKKRLQILFSLAGLAACSLGLIMNVSGIFFNPIAEELNVGIGAVSITSTLTTLSTGFTAVYALKSIQKVSLRKVLILSVAVTILSTFLMAFCKNIWLLYFLSLIRGISSCFFNTPVITSIIGKWFISSRGTFSGIIMAFSGLSGALMSPFLNNIIQHYDYRVALVTCSVMMLIVSLPGILFLHYSPEEEGYLPYQKETNEGSKTEGEDFIGFKSNSSVFVTVLLVSFVCQAICSFCQHLSGYGESIGHDSSIGSLMISMAMIGNIMGKFMIGMLSDLIGALRSGFVLILIFMSGSLFLLVGNNLFWLLAGSLLLGTSYASAVMLSNVAFAVYGSKQYNDAYALITIVINIAGAFSVALIGYAYDFCGSYRFVLAVIICISVIALLAIVWIKRKVDRYALQNKTLIS